MLKLEDYTIINIWTSADNPALQGANVGHVSLETCLGYISLWPNKNHKADRLPQFFQQPERKVKLYLGERPADFKKDYENDCLLEALAEKEMRPIENINECEEGEIAVLWDSLSNNYSRLDSQPRGIKETEKISAVRPVQANVRLVVYGLNVHELQGTFNDLKQKITRKGGWRLIGSNMLTRLTSEGAENCASLAYRCLKAGGMYNKLAPTLSSQTSSIIKPDDLVRHIIAYKEQELQDYPDTSNWKRPNVTESSLDTLKEQYKMAGLNANIEHDKLPSVTCNIL